MAKKTMHFEVKFRTHPIKEHSDNSLYFSMYSQETEDCKTLEKIALHRAIYLNMQNLF